MHTDCLSTVEEIKGNTKLPEFCEVIDKRLKLGTKKLTKNFPNPLYFTINQSPITSRTSSVGISKKINANSKRFLASQKHIIKKEGEVICKFIT